MNRSVLLLTAAVLACPFLNAEDKPAPAKPASPAAPAKQKLKIIPGKVIVPTGDGEMKRPWGELISIDLKTRTGKFRNESNDEVISFTVLPYAELLHHAAFGDLDDFRVGERAIFRLHENDDGKWTWLTYIQDQMNMMNGHGEYYFVDSIDAGKGELSCTQANPKTKFTREKGIIISTDGETRYWKKGEPAKFSDIHVGDPIRTKTHGIGHGKMKMCWEVFLDDESLKKFQDEQKAAHAKRMTEEGAPGYVDVSTDKDLELSLFWEANDVSHALKPGQSVRIAPAGVDRKPTAEPVHGTVSSATKFVGPVGKVIITLDAPTSIFQPGQVARLWMKP